MKIMLTIGIIMYLFGFLLEEHSQDKPDYSITIENGIVKVIAGCRYVGSGDLTEVEEIILKDKKR